MIQKQMRDLNSSKYFTPFEKKIKKQTIFLKYGYLPLVKKKNNSLTLVKKQPVNSFGDNFFKILGNKKGRGIGRVQLMKHSLAPTFIRKGNHSTGFLSIESTVLFFYLLQVYGKTLYNQNNRATDFTPNFYYNFCRKKLTLLNNYMDWSEPLLHRLPRQKKELPDSNKKKNKGKFLNKHNIFFFSCKKSKNILFFNKNIPTKYFLNYQNHFENVASSFYKTRIDFNLIKVNGFYKSAQFIVDEIIYFLEKRVSYNKIKNRLKKELFNGNHRIPKGIRISYSGRLGGKTNKAERKKIDSLSFGQTSLHILSSKIDFATGYAETKFGIAGIKVWLSVEN